MCSPQATDDELRAVTADESGEIRFIKFSMYFIIFYLTVLLLDCGMSL